MTVREILEVIQGVDGLILSENGIEQEFLLTRDDVPNEGELKKKVKIVSWANQYLYIEVEPKKIQFKQIMPFICGRFEIENTSTGERLSGDRTDIANNHYLKDYGSWFVGGISDWPGKVVFLLEEGE